MATGNEPPYDHWAAGFACIGGGDLKDEEPRLAKCALVPYLISARKFDFQFQRGFRTIFQILNLGQSRSILIPHWQVAEEIFDCRVCRVFLAGVRGNSCSELAREVWSESCNSKFVKILNWSVEGNSAGHCCRIIAQRREHAGMLEVKQILRLAMDKYNQRIQLYNLKAPAVVFRRKIVDVEELIRE